MQWNAASDDWHTTSASVDLREGGTFSSRMEAKDGSAGFDFTGTYTRIIGHQCIEYAFDGRTVQVEFLGSPEGIRAHITFDSDEVYSVEQQQAGWQSILNNFKNHVESADKA